MIAPHTLERWIDAYIDGRISPDQMAELDAALRTSPEARKRFHEALRDHHVLIEAQLAPASQKTPAPICPLATSRSRLRVPLAIAAALLLIAAAVAIYVFAGSRPLFPVPSDSSAPIATLIDATGDVFADDDIAYPGAELTARTVSISSGSAEILLTSGASIRLRGRTRLSLNSDMAATLESGVATFNCPESAVGYTVELPDGSRIVDLGTRFTVRVGDEEARVDVVAGRVRVDAMAVQSEPIAPIQLSAGWSCERTVSKGRSVTRVFREIPIANPSFEADGSDVRAKTPTGWRADLPQRVYIHSADSKEATVQGAKGRYVGTINSIVAGRDPSGVAPALWQDVPGPVEGGVGYELRVLVGRRADYDQLKIGPTYWRIELVDAESGEPFAALPGDPPPTGRMVEHTLTFTPTPEQVGRPMRLRLVNPQGTTAPGLGKVLFDDVRLHAIPIASTPPTPLTPGSNPEK